MARQKNIRRSKRNTSRMLKKDNDGLELFEHLGGKTSVRQKRKMRSKNSNLQKKLSKKNVKSQFNRNQLVNKKKKMNSKKKRNMKNKQKGKLSTKIIKSHGSRVKTGYGIQKHMKGGGPRVVDGKLQGHTDNSLNGKNAAQLKEADFNARKLKDVGFNARDLKNADFSEDDLTGAGFDNRLVNEGWGSNFDLVLLKEAGFNAGKLKDAGFNAGELIEIGFSGKILKNEGFTARDLYEAGFTSKISLSNIGFSEDELRIIF